VHESTHKFYLLHRLDIVISAGTKRPVCPSAATKRRRATELERTSQRMISINPISVNMGGSNSLSVTVKEAKAVVEDIATLNGVFSDELIQRAEGDRDIKRLIESNSNLKSIANNATHK